MDKIEIKADRLLLVEGNDDQNFFQKLIEDIGPDGIQIISMKGKENFGIPNLKSIINTPGFREVKSLGIVLDADENANNTFSSICTVLRECGLPVPAQPMQIISASLKVGVLVIPPGVAKGEIEDLCLAAIKEYNELECIENYFSCLKEKLPLDKFPRDLSKAKVQAFLASREESVPHLGVAAQKGFFPLDHNIFEDIKIFLRSL
jgi:hypothetical protein